MSQPTARSATARPAPRPRHNPLWKQLLTPLASLRLTVILLSLSIFLILAGTLALVDKGIPIVEKEYFHSFGVIVKGSLFVPRDPQTIENVNPLLRAVFKGLSVIRVPMPGGYTMGLLLLANLLAAHSVRFKFTLKRTGIILIHFALVLLIVGEGIRSGASVESFMTIEEGQTANYSQSQKHVELAIIDRSPSSHDDVTVISDRLLKTGKVIKDTRLPFEVRIDEFYPNAELVAPSTPNSKAMANRGITDAALRPIPRSTGVAGGAIDLPGAFVTLSRNGQDLGTYIVSSMFRRPQPVEIDGRTYELGLRFAHLYKPYSLHLLDFTFDRYLGTKTPKNFASKVRLVDPERNVDRELVISMNAPLRYRGETYFQADWNKETEQGTVLQVVKNPGWTLPYIACIIGGIGLFVHFGIVLVNFLGKTGSLVDVLTVVLLFTAPLWGVIWLFLGAGVRARMRARLPMRAKAAGELPRSNAYVLPEPSLFARLLPLAITVFFALYVMGRLFYSAPRAPFDLDAFSKVPVSYEGRVQPLDSLARNHLKTLSGKESPKLYTGKESPFLKSMGLGGKKLDPVQWLAETMSSNPAAAHYAIVRVDHQDIKSMLGLDTKERYFSVADLMGTREKELKLNEQIARVRDIKSADRDLYQNQIAQLDRQLGLYQGLNRMERLYLVAPLREGEEWMPVGQAALIAQQTGKAPLSAESFMRMIQAYAQNDPAAFNRYVAEHHNRLASSPVNTKAVAFEAFYNRFDPLMSAAVLYLVVFLLAAMSWVGFREPLRRSAFYLLVFALLLHTFALIARIYISGRPPVTNLASSAIFIAWGAALLAVFVEKIFKNSLGATVAGIIGFIGLLIYFALARDGDTMAVLQAVLDTNFWLATHVVCITLGYAATFLAGLVAMMWIIRSFQGAEYEEERKMLTRVTYGVTCFAILFSFIGTVLGGIWADQSWGRFWGWDPKENGAVLIVLANALLLHARWGGLAQARGIAALAIFGSIVCSWSWFGTNMLGIGLHSYGFMDSAAMWLALFMLSQVVLITLSLFSPAKK